MDWTLETRISRNVAHPHQYSCQWGREYNDPLLFAPCSLSTFLQKFYGERSKIKCGRRKDGMVCKYLCLSRHSSLCVSFTLGEKVAWQYQNCSNSTKLELICLAEIWNLCQFS
jgi:hypothetical protein